MIFFKKIVLVVFPKKGIVEMAEIFSGFVNSLDEQLNTPHIVCSLTSVTRLQFSFGTDFSINNLYTDGSILLC